MPTLYIKPKAARGLQMLESAVMLTSGSSVCPLRHSPLFYTHVIFIKRALAADGNSQSPRLTQRVKAVDESRAGGLARANGAREKDLTLGRAVPSPSSRSAPGEAHYYALNFKMLSSLTEMHVHVSPLGEEHAPFCIMPVTTLLPSPYIDGGRLADAGVRSFANGCLVT
ncbi:uncharacterized protein MCYG_06409 [Microsporum canis CBS 113480]|uniref:Uncharacterized protein n=1 Tax=Arthroderma otae (strain ATCC MYA-4605 / CBS 113480) TaxID=554155 RepID=C5FUK6_ARTOC|nr:uncharacterized protein MCYG_06409 [Microsporum canis CBS 113480]EEQ33590.1 predicted protein [Microsporum canis CBS 113480]